MRWVKRVAAGVAVLATVLVLVVAIGSEIVIRRTRASPLPAIAADRTAAGLAEGTRLAAIEGCADCHRDGRGRVMVESALIGRIAPPALARAAASYSDAELARLIRFGVKRDGRTVFVMPTREHRYLADEDVARLISWLRTLKAGPDDDTGGNRYGPLLRAAVMAGGLPVEAHQDDVSAPTRPANRGAYIYRTACSGCHELHALGESDPADGRRAPALAEMGAAYDPAAFRRLLRTGVDQAGHPLGLMRQVAVGGLHALTDEEISALQTYLEQQAKRPEPS